MLSDEKLTELRSKYGLLPIMDLLRAVAEAAIAADRAARAEPVVPEYDRNAYEELRSIIDGGSESMTHADAVEWCKRHADAEWRPVKPAAPVVPEWLPIETAPKDGESVLLLIENAEHPLYDDSLAVSIGCYGVAGEDRWSWAGWNWTHDEFCEGRGTPVGWMPLPAAPSRPGDETEAEK